MAGSAARNGVLCRDKWGLEGCPSAGTHERRMVEGGACQWCLTPSTEAEYLAPVGHLPVATNRGCGPVQEIPSLS